MINLYFNPNSFSFWFSRIFKKRCASFGDFLIFFLTSILSFSPWSAGGLTANPASCRVRVNTTTRCTSAVNRAPWWWLSPTEQPIHFTLLSVLCPSEEVVSQLRWAQPTRLSAPLARNRSLWVVMEWRQYLVFGLFLFH